MSMRRAEKVRRRAWRKEKRRNQWTRRLERFMLRGDPELIAGLNRLRAGFKDLHAMKHDNT